MEGFTQQMTELDQIGRNILRELSSDGRMSNLDLAERVGLSPSACLRRVQDLERRGIIRGYRAVLDRTALGNGFVAYVGVGLTNHSKAVQEGFEIAIKHSPEVRECHNVTGAFEYILRVETADLAAFKHFHTEVLGTIAHVGAITSYVTMGSPKDERA